MKKLLQQIKKRISILLEWVCSKILPYVDRMKANRSIKKLQKKKNNPSRPIKVGFVVQMPEVWDKEAPLYEKMTSNPMIDPWLIVVPSYDLTKRGRGNYGAELEYFKNRYPSAKILTTQDLTFDYQNLKNCEFEYIFFQRCWEAYIPEQLRTYKVLPYAKTCYIPYAYHSFEDSQDYYKTRFFYSLYVLFCCSDAQLKSYLPYGHQKSVFKGFPVLESAEFTGVQDYQKLRFAWTPRWTTDPEYGGTSFLDYKDRFIELQQMFPKIQVLLRPHPLTFEHMINCGHMTEEEVAEYKLRNENAGVHFDRNADFEVTLKQIDGIITDFSSIVIEALMCGKIIIFCGKEPQAAPSEILREILKCSYICRNWDEIVATLKMLSNHDDPLLPARKALADKLHCAHENSSERIVEWIISDSKDAGIEECRATGDRFERTL